MASIWTLMLAYHSAVTFPVLSRAVLLINCWDRLFFPLLNPFFVAEIQLPLLPQSLLSPDTHPQALSSLWSSHHLSALAQGPPSRLISGLCCVQAHTLRGVGFFIEMGGGLIYSFIWAVGCFAWIQKSRTTSTQWKGEPRYSAELTIGDYSEKAGVSAYWNVFNSDNSGAEYQSARYGHASHLKTGVVLMYFSEKCLKSAEMSLSHD